MISMEIFGTTLIIKTDQEREVQRLPQSGFKQLVLFFITIFRLTIPAFFRFTDVTELMWESQYYIDGECRNKSCLKGRGGNDVQHKNLSLYSSKRNRGLSTIRKYRH